MTDRGETLLAVRFELNMGRLADLVRLVTSGRLPKGSKPFERTGVGADISRAIVVFLHATFEDILRTVGTAKRGRNAKVESFGSWPPVKRILEQIGLDPTPFEDLKPPLKAMMERRHRIVHRADLSNPRDRTSATWTIADEWQLIMWLLTVVTFYSLLCVSMNPANDIERAAYQRRRKAMDRVVTFGKQLVGVGQAAPDRQSAALQEAFETVKGALDSLR